MELLWLAWAGAWLVLGWAVVMGATAVAVGAAFAAGGFSALHLWLWTIGGPVEPPRR